MAEVNAKDLTTKTAPASTDSMLLFGTTTNEGAKITVDNLATNILERLATKTFPNQVGGSSAATILAQLATLNSNIKEVVIQIHTDEIIASGGYYQITAPTGFTTSNSMVFCQMLYMSGSKRGYSIVQWSESARFVYFKDQTGANWLSSETASFALLFVKI